MIHPDDDITDETKAIVSSLCNAKKGSGLRRLQLLKNKRENGLGETEEKKGMEIFLSKHNEGKGGHGK